MNETKTQTDQNDNAPQLVISGYKVKAKNCPDPATARALGEKRVAEIDARVKELKTEKKNLNSLRHVLMRWLKWLGPADSGLLRAHGAHAREGRAPLLAPSPTARAIMAAPAGYLPAHASPATITLPACPALPPAGAGAPMDASPTCRAWLEHRPAEQEIREDQ
jgi:hypothetical protein